MYNHSESQPIFIGNQKIFVNLQRSKYSDEPPAPQDRRVTNIKSQVNNSNIQGANIGLGGSFDGGPLQNNFTDQSEKQGVMNSRGRYLTPGGKGGKEGNITIKSKKGLK